MPTFAVTPQTSGANIGQSAVDPLGSIKRCTTTLRLGATPNVALIQTFMSTKWALSNLGLYRWRGGGETRFIGRAAAEAYDELYSIDTTMRVEFLSSLTNTIVYDRIPAPNLSYTSGAALDLSITTVSDYIAAAIAALESGTGETLAYSASVLEDTDVAILVQPVTTDPAGEAGNPATPI